MPKCSLCGQWINDPLMAPRRVQHGDDVLCEACAKRQGWYVQKGSPYYPH